MTELFLSIFEISLSMSILVAVLLLLAPLLGRRYAAKWKFLIWFVLALRLVVPVSGQSLQQLLSPLRQQALQSVSGVGLVGFQTVSKVESAGPRAGQEGAESADPQTRESTGALADRALLAQTAPVTIEIPAQMTTEIAVQSKQTGVTLLDVAACVWLAGCFVFLSLHIIIPDRYGGRHMETDRRDSGTAGFGGG